MLIKETSFKDPDIPKRCKKKKQAKSIIRTEKKNDFYIKKKNKYQDVHLEIENILFFVKFKKRIS